MRYGNFWIFALISIGGEVLSTWKNSPNTAIEADTIKLRLWNRALLPYINRWLQNLLAFLHIFIPSPLAYSNHRDSELLYSSPVVSNRVVGQESFSLAHSRRAGHLVD